MEVFVAELLEIELLLSFRLSDRPNDSMVD